MICAVCKFKDGDKSNGWLEEFKEVKGTFLMELGVYHKTNAHVYLYACPRCGTIRTSRFGDYNPEGEEPMTKPEQFNCEQALRLEKLIRRTIEDCERVSYKDTGHKCESRKVVEKILQRFEDYQKERGGE